jgi:ribitol-5-phosphate 2-dehydrogenase
MILEKGLTLVGCSRSSAEDFKRAIHIIHDESVRDNLRKIVSEETRVRNSGELEKAFKKDMSSPFKSVLEWAV